MKRTMIIMAAATLMMAACDKIASDEYTIAGSGATGGDNWRNANPHRVYVEKYTGPKCPNCPDADITLEAAHQRFGDNLVIVSINHPKGQGEPFAGEPDMRTEAGTAWDTYFGINAIPAAYINRNTAKQYSGAMSNIGADIESVIATSAQAGITITATAVGDSITVDADISILSTISDQLTLTLAITEDSLAYRQIDGDEIVDGYVHNHMLRAVITDIWGNDIPVEGNAGDHVIGTFGYNAAGSGINLANSHVVALVSRKSDRQVLNCAECRIE